MGRSTRIVRKLPLVDRNKNVNAPSPHRVCRFSLVASVVLAVAAGAAQAATLTDDFNSSHDYSGGNTTGTIWDGFRAAGTGTSENDVNLVAAEADNATGNGTAGQLHFQSSDGDWENNNNDGAFLFKNVTGDFVADIEVTSATQVDYHDMGIMAREPNLADAGAGEDYVSVKHFTPTWLCTSL